MTDDVRTTADELPRRLAGITEMAARMIGLYERELAERDAAMDWHVKTIHQYSENAERHKLRAACYEDVLRLILALPPERLDEVPLMVERALEQ